MARLGICAALSRQGIMDREFSCYGVAIVVVEILLAVCGFYMDRGAELTLVNGNMDFKECVGEEEATFHVKCMR